VYQDAAMARMIDREDARPAIRWRGSAVAVFSWLGPSWLGPSWMVSDGTFGRGIEFDRRGRNLILWDRDLLFGNLPKREKSG
jgi:hypothetical protein